MPGPLAVWRLAAFRRCWGHSPREDILDELASTLDDLLVPSRRNDLEWRAAWARLEHELRHADPKLREKIETAPSVSNLVLATRRARPSDGESTPEAAELRR